jgi:CubicO group peptidase (beta-lactamase class C family)
MGNNIEIHEVCFIFIFSISFSSDQLRAQITSGFIDSLAESCLNSFNVAGAAVAVVQDGKVIHSRGYGYKNILNKTPVNDKTNFAIASNTKAFTAAALAILVEEGKLKWEDKVVLTFPNLKCMITM